MKISFSKYLFAFMVVGLIFTSCGDDPIGGGTGNGDAELSISLISSSTVAPNDTIYVTVTAQEGLSPLNTITVSEDGVTLPQNRVLFDGVAAANPLLLFGVDKVSFTKQVGVVVSGDLGSHNYVFKVDDDASNSNSKEIDITVETEVIEIDLSITTTSPATVAPNDTIYVTMTAKEGSSPLNTITVTEDGSNLSLDRVLFDGSSVANPLLLIGTDKVEFTKEVGVIVSGDLGAHTYNFKVTDDAGNAKGGDLGITVELTAPTFSIVGDGVRSALPGTLISIALDAEKGSVDLDQIRVDVDGVLLADISSLEYDGTDFSNNPEILTGANRMALDGNLLMRTPMSGGTYVVTVSIIDAAGNVASQDITLLVGTTPNVFMEAVFFNVVGSGNGAMDLDNGISTTQNSPEAEIRDLGVDGTIDPTVTENWFKKIEPVNGAAMAKLVPGMNNLAEGFTFESIQFAEDVIALVDNQTPLAEGNNTGSVVVGDMFLVSNAASTKVYVFVIREVNAVAGSNDDNYVIDIKTSL